MENLTGISAPVRPLPCVVPCKLYFAEGKITEKERLLWEYVLSAYGAEEFTTKQLEKDFRNAAYATIRTFVMKFHEMGLLTARKAGNRVFYRVGGTSDGRPLRAKCSLSDLLR